MAVEVVTLREVARMLGISPETLHYWIRQGKFPLKPLRVGPRGRFVLFLRQEVEEYLKGRREGQYEL